MSKKNIIISASVFAALIVLLLLPIQVPMSIDVPCKISPANKWFVELGNDGNILTSLHNARSGSIENYFSAIPERGDSYVFTLVKDPAESWVEQGDTIGLIQSNLLARQYAELSGRLKTSQANLDILMTGEKESLIRQALQQLNAARENADYQQKIYEIKNELFEKNLISFEEIELFRSQARQAEIDVAAKSAYLESIQTGSKQEQVNLVNNQIRAIEQELKVLDEKKESYVIRSPIRGIVNSYNSVDTILSVSSPNRILFIPVAWRYHPLIHKGLKVDLNIAADSIEVTYTVSKIANDIQQFNGQQVLTLIATTQQEGTSSLPDNLWTTCTLSFGDISLWEFVKWKLSQTYEV